MPFNTTTRAAAGRAVGLMAGLVVSMAAVLLWAPSARAAGSADPGPPPGNAEILAALTLDQAVSLAERTLKARVVRADTQRDGERVVYVLRMLNAAGRVWTVRVDAQSGQMQ